MRSESGSSPGSALAWASMAVALLVTPMPASHAASEGADPAVRKQAVPLAMAADSEVVAALGSQDSTESCAAAEEVMRRGERMIPLLLSLKGDNRKYSGHNLGGRSAGALYWEYTENPADSVTRDIRYHVVYVEVAAIYLVEAIYEQTIRFANAPFLTERTTGVSSNLPELVADAWRSVEEWEALRKERGIAKLRSERHGPLGGARSEFQ
jgi:hypothetical protein